MGGQEVKMIVAFCDPLCQGIFGHQSMKALSPSEHLHKILKLHPLPLYGP